MYTIYIKAMKIAEDQKATIIRLDIQFSYITQSHTGYLVLSNGHEYSIVPSTDIATIASP